MAYMQLKDTPGIILIDDWDVDNLIGRSYFLRDPINMVVAKSPQEVLDCLALVDHYLKSGKFAAGYVAYEAGTDLTLRKTPGHQLQLPYVWFGIYDQCEEAGYDEVDCGDESGLDDISDIHLNISSQEYLEGVQQIKEYIEKGDVYQINYTCKLLFNHKKPALQLFARLRRAHRVGFSAYINTGDYQIASLSPELFLKREGKQIISRPMKGTAGRGKWSAEDNEIASHLMNDEKNRAENLMILDLMRNDLGRISTTGSIEVPRIFHIERYPSLFQMTSDVTGCLQEGTSLIDIFKATFPPGSITGAPKIRAMELIYELEREARGVYCGSIGLFRPGGDFLLNVAIRTIVQQGEKCEMGIGSGIVADSNPHSELQETLLKGHFLSSIPKEFHLLETMLFRSDEVIVHLEKHLERISQSATYFGRPFSKKNMREALAATTQAITGIAKIRLLVSKTGVINIEWDKIDEQPNHPVKLLVASRQTNPDDIFLYHKTTHRQAYDEDLKVARKDGYYDLLYTNTSTRGELTEGAISNIIVEIDGQQYTPPLSSGLLPGVWRKKLLAEGQVTERVLTLNDLEKATRVFVGNSVRGTKEVLTIDKLQSGQITQLFRLQKDC